MQLKQCIVVRDDLKLSTGKLAVQVAHASIMAMELTRKDIVEQWKEEGMRKIVLRGGDEEHLFRLKSEAESLGIPAAIVRDAGLTEVPPGTVTALGLGPAPDEIMDRVTGRLSLL
ncbi:MAG TPA: peptidyl-tRNA hydrolase Pth2 [Methanothrix sp.]|nr:peptidyl-tRNA hydrolase Pth2 [Methanothrix sp.]HOK58636.1 peptidyl-tRNA hydrolase Pth2 [Methanothrix sp.]HOL43805.1 peptidyl-tRNA hydrolase Pth2 [Methanothrix sp.]HPO88890.1 peptidyl-tRNA hydrolase Pth2 [Methanothrix sp.]